MRFRKRRSRAAWAFSDSALLRVGPGAASATASFLWLLPPARVQFLCDTDRVSNLIFMGSHLWLDFAWQNSGTTTPQLLPDVTFYVIKSQMDRTGDVPTETLLLPWSTPTTPATLTSWDELDTDGTSPFLWCHHLSGLCPPNSIVETTDLNRTNGGQSQYNSNNSIAWTGGTTEGFPVATVVRNFDVRAAWQPDVRIKARRRLQKTEGIALVMQSDTGVASGVTLNLRAYVRTLVRRGR